MQTTAIRLFGQGAAEDLLKLYGRPATVKELYTFMLANYGQVLTFEMLGKALKVGTVRRNFKAWKDNTEIDKEGRRSKCYKYSIMPVDEPQPRRITI